ncbi:zinc-binding dehydrogenase [Alteribacter aurantiacus]|uniref:zinc-binding dehydrogenase n=1 Tax=Alteribacter aurantiacus TaxID=254410 RepID=UPI0004086D13|nr:zinc-binding dehydrogenase [Alteribacter aurantiacus]
MRAVIHKDKKGYNGLTFVEDFREPTPKEGEVKVKLKTAGLNHRDLFVLDRHNPDDPPFVIGSDGAGTVEQVGVGVTDFLPGEEVMINPGLYWERLSDAPPEGFEVLGFPNNGTFADYVIIPASAVVPKPDYLSWEEAGVFSLAALTAYRALFTRGKLKEGMNVFIPGIGSGVATFLLQFAKAQGANVYVSSRSEEKRRRAVELGAVQAVDSEGDWSQEFGRAKMDLVIECVGAATFNKSLDTLRKGGTIVTFGSSTGDEIEIDLRKFFYGQFNMLGSTMGSGEEFSAMLDFIQTHRIKPIMDRVYPLHKYQDAFDRLQEANQFGKIAFTIS